MQSDEAFEESGKQPGLEIWRIEKMKIVKQENTSSFYTGDAYIILSTKKNPKHDKLSWDIHFWLGAESSKDEQGVAAYKTVELDSHLGGAPVQYREVQNHESQLFLSYFKKGITYLSGGIDSGFRKVEKGVYQKRLLHVKGKRNVRVTQVKCDITSLNTGDVFVLDCGEQIFVWIGPKSRGTERLKGMEVGKRIRDEERSGKATITIIDKKWDSDVEFFKYFDSHGTIRSEDSEVDDDVFENQKGLLQLYRVCDAQGKIEMTEVCGRPLRREMLDSNDCFILDTGTSGIFVWIGRKCSVNERKCGWKLALEFLEKKNYPEWTQVTRVVGHGETPLFKQYFEGWTETQAIIGKSRAYSIGSIARANRAKFDATILHKHQPFKEKEQLPDDGTGLITIWHVFDKKLNSVPSEEYGTFYSGACYIILYVCCGAGGDGTQMLYFWQGNKSSKEDIAACVVMVQAIDIKEVNGKAVQVRITQYQEPEHFLRIFHGKLIVLKGDGRKQDDFHSKTMLFHVRGYSEFNTRAFQVEPIASSLNSNDAFVLIHQHLSYLWFGRGANPEERKMAKNVMTYLTNISDPEAIFEGKEPDTFWEILGGQENYASDIVSEVSGMEMPPRLFHCSDASGCYKVEEIFNYSQEDLFEDDVMLLDTYKEIYVWIGKGANEEEKRESLETAMDYIKSDPSGRTIEATLIVQIKQGSEPFKFRGCFIDWDPKRWAKAKSYDEVKQELERQNAGIAFVRDELSQYTEKYPLAMLQRKFLPRGIDQTNREKYLSQEDFQKVFKMSPEEFYSKPAWKQIDLKKKYKLF